MIPQRVYRSERKCVDVFVNVISFGVGVMISPLIALSHYYYIINNPDSKVHGAHLGPTGLLSGKHSPMQHAPMDSVTVDIL